MDHYILLGLIQGLTEFLPVSSSGHLFLAQTFLGLEPNLSLEVYLHAASLLAVIIFFWDTIWELVEAFFKQLSTISLLLSAPKNIPTAAGTTEKQQQKSSHRSSPPNPQALLTLKLLVATLITFPIALILKDFVLIDLSNKTVARALLITGIMILIAEKFRPPKVREFTWSTVILLGIVQGVAVIPGISRSGSTIALLILLGIQRKDSAEISFLLSIPTILGALVFIIFKQGFADFDFAVLLASVVCFLASILAIKWMMKLIQSKWVYFVPYCLLLGLGLLFF